MKNQGYNLGEISKKLSQKALDEGSRDNVTLIIVDISQYYTELIQKRNCQSCEDDKLNCSMEAPQQSDDKIFQIPKSMGKKP